MIEARVLQIIAETNGLAEPPQLAESLRDDVGFDDLDFIDMVLALEEAFDIEIAAEDFDTLERVQDVVNFVTAAVPQAVA